ncbi:hypothetical protein KIN20_025098 [Parelaphostrongylus tenuis]|uniref:Uncharacterized protein n=1 Tax=Parelaphostrongylus tenuis TaxID=148309 RepID=A0AAD5MUN4_PARTN|nr:hypothetical protein KIN20_025098 [Parelaphostrongylus tenuis]
MPTARLPTSAEPVHSALHQEVMLSTVTLFNAVFALVIADFSPSFNAFLTNAYGKYFADRMARRDMGAAGSFGGGNHVAGRRTAFVFTF